MMDEGSGTRDEDEDDEWTRTRTSCCSGDCNLSARLVVGRQIGHYEDMIPALSELHWLPVLV